MKSTASHLHEVYITGKDLQSSREQCNASSAEKTQRVEDCGLVSDDVNWINKPVDAASGERKKVVRRIKESTVI